MIKAVKEILERLKNVDNNIDKVCEKLAVIDEDRVENLLSESEKKTIVNLQDDRTITLRVPPKGERIPPSQQVEKSTPLISITQESVYSVPKVYIRGEEITDKVEIKFNWVESEDKDSYNTNIKVRYYDEDLKNYATITIE